MRRATTLLLDLSLVLTLLAAGGCNIEEAAEPEMQRLPDVEVTPLSGSVDHSVPVELTWTLAADVVWAESVTVHCDTIQPPVAAVFEGEGSAFVVGDLLDGRTYFWTVTAADTAGTEYQLGPWSFETRPFRCRLTPLPEHLSLNLEPDPVLSWDVASASDTPAYYLAYVDSMNPPQHLAYAGPDSSFRVTGLEFETAYYWRVTAVDGSDNTDTSGPWRFDTGPPAFLVDLEPAPADSAIDLDRVVTLSWNTISGTAPVENWVVFLDDYPQPVTLVHAGTDSTVTLQDLRYGRTYWWTVTAFDDEGHTFSNGPWELTVRDFDVMVEPSPADGSTQVNTAGMLRWPPTRGVEMVVNWLVMLDTSPQPTTPVYTGPATGINLADLNLAPNTTYYWRLNALDIDGFTCPLGPYSFTTAP